MAEERTLARPYAQATFELASEAGDLAGWHETLERLSAIVTNEDVTRLLGNPLVDDGQMADAIIDVAGEGVVPQTGSLVKVLADNGRLRLLPAICEQFAVLRAAAENRIDVEITAASEIAEAQQEAVGKALKKRFNREISLSVTVDPELIGGAIVRAGDMVIDNSVRAQLERLDHSVTH
jgi:F-type H+-transporting ATPase subunit delta